MKTTALAIQADRILAYLRSQQDSMVAFLRELVEAESPSDVPATQQQVLALLSAALENQGFRVRHIRGQATGGHLVASPRTRAKGQPQQLLIGHCDTVWPAGTLHEMPVKVSDGTMKGPGVYDMKAGLTQIVYALQALNTLRLQPEVTPLVMINTDEEIGSHESAPTILRLVRTVCRAFVMEPSLGPSGQLKTRRKGVGHFSVLVTGKAAHAGLNPEGGVSAILELSHVIQQLFALNDPARGTTVNVGVIDGGLRANVIAPESSAKVDVRVASPEEAERVEQAIRELKPDNPAVTLEITGRIERPPMQQTPQNRQLWELAQDLGRHLGMQLEQGVAGGASDGNLTSLYVPTLDGLGAVGDGAHARHEFVQIESLPQRCALLALLLLAPAEQDG